MSEKDNTMCYVAKKSCGCTVAVAVDVPEQKKDNADFVAEWIKAGLTVHSMTVGEFHASGSPFDCQCEKTEQQPLLGARDE